MIKSLSILIARLWGSEYRVHLSFLLLVAYIIVPEMDQSDSRVGRALILSLLVLGAVLVHELGHLLAARARGITQRLIILLPIGGVPLREAAEGSREMPAGDETRIALAGPLISITTGVVILMVAANLHPEIDFLKRPHFDLGGLWKCAGWAHIYLGVMNLIPAYPLDGGRVLRAILAGEKGTTYEAATRRAVTIGQIFAACLMFAGLKDIWLMLFGFILFVGVQLEDRTLLFHAIVDTVHLEDIMLTDFATLSPADTLEDALQRSVHSLQDDFPVIREGILVGVINRSRIAEALKAEGNAYVQSAMSKAFEVAQKRASLAWALRQFTSGASIIPVVEDQMLVGIVTRQNLMRSMGLLAETRKIKQELSEQNDEEDEM